MPINTVEVYYNSVLILYMKGSVLKAVVAISVISTAISKWLKALLASFILIEVTLLGVRSLKAVK
jgi:predicted neutral ceramidase superfamily lipid hydrolase